MYQKKMVLWNKWKISW